ncbi:GNAT family N-acetyltransferase [Arthrobacter castelli]|uniref:GNAT family N-acetyltransferase n=1 Tax=Arthrobacter castelli TaxID=271431 RepID=UPI0003FCEAF5|nr:GNAT family N-acetyltransferase [Arthrobacter castelli]
MTGPGRQQVAASTGVPPEAGVRIRPVRAQDYDDVARLTAAAYIGEGFVGADDGDYLPMLMDTERRAGHGELLVAELEHQVVGAVTLAEAGGEYADIARDGELEFRMLAVDPRVQRKGVGRALVRAIVEHARERERIDAVVLSTEEKMGGAHQLYASLGFQRRPDRDWAVPEYGIRLLVFHLAV